MTRLFSRTSSVFACHDHAILEEPALDVFLAFKEYVIVLQHPAGKGNDEGWMRADGKYMRAGPALATS